MEMWLGLQIRKKVLLFVPFLTIAFRNFGLKLVDEKNGNTLFT
jgi:hypothetical protein